jgi:hypothetical protein
MTFKESIEKYSYFPDWRNLVDANFLRNSGVYSYLVSTETDIFLDKDRLKLPRKIVFMSKYERFRRKSSKNTVIEYKGRRILIKEKIQIIPFGTYDRKYKFSGTFSEILNDLIKQKNIFECKFSEKLLETGNYPLFGIDSNIKYPSYLLQISDKFKFQNLTEKQINNYIIENEELKSVIKDILATIGIYYELYDINPEMIYVIFPLPYVKILENRLDTSDKNEKVSLTLEFNKDFYNVFKKSTIELHYEIKELNSEFSEKSFFKFEFTGKSIYEIKINPKNITKIGLCSFKVLINEIEVNQFKGTYIRGFKINTKIIEK